MIPLTKETVLLLHKYLTDATGGKAGLRDETLLDSALASAFPGAGGKDGYPDKLRAAAHLCCALISKRPFADGNQRLGVFAMLVFLEINGIKPSCSDSELLRLGQSVADGSMGYRALVQWLFAHQA